MSVIHSLLSSAETRRYQDRLCSSSSLGPVPRWLAKHLPEAKVVPCASNSTAAELAADNENNAAIASQKAAEIYKLKVLETGINDQPGNETRFIALAKLETKPTGNDKTSMIIVLNDKPGALHEVLGILAEKNISMTRLESQPYGKGQYAFYIDFVGHSANPEAAEMINKIDKITRICQVLGSYPKEPGK